MGSTAVIAGRPRDRRVLGGVALLVLALGCWWFSG